VWHGGEEASRAWRTGSVGAVATTDVFAGLFMSWSRVKAVAMQSYSTRILWRLIVWHVNTIALEVWLKVEERPLVLGQSSEIAVEYRHLGPILGQQRTEVVYG
jgi:hypothetical protein